MLDISFGELIVIGSATLLILGKKDMPLVFRMLGRGLGKVSGMVQGARIKMNDMSEGSELLKLQQEIRASIDDVKTIRAEVAMAGRLPPGITRSSHPGSTLLREGYPDQRPPQGQEALEQGQGMATGAQETAGSKCSGIVGLSSQSTFGRPPSGASGAARMGTGLQLDSGGGGGGGGGVGGWGGGASVGGGAFATGLQVKSSGGLSPGGERLQHLAMAELQFAEKEMYAPKTDAIPGGADILNETITDSLLFERYQHVVGAVQGRGRG
ncbi:unnamed protein product, partial [Discosporangium mesarthrocarpum]